MQHAPTPLSVSHCAFLAGTLSNCPPGSLAALLNPNFSFNSRSGIKDHGIQEGQEIKKQNQGPLPVIINKVRNHWSMSRKERGEEQRPQSHLPAPACFPPGPGPPCAKIFCGVIILPENVPNVEVLLGPHQ